jgi:hypothetical protein
MKTLVVSCLLALALTIVPVGGHYTGVSASTGGTTGGHRPYPSPLPRPRPIPA